jgi:hypothetical protein
MATPNINTILRGMQRSARYGAPMGRRNCNDSNSPLYLQRVRFIDGDYAADGTYWGGGRGTDPLWCAFNGEDDTFAPGRGTQIYVRAKTRAQAMAEILERYPDVTFHKET